MVPDDKELKKLFIINPKAGNKEQNRVIKGILRQIANPLTSHKVVFTKSIGDASEFAKKSLGLYDIVVSVGGDGTINEVGKNLVGENSIMGIIPKGSGNGLARELNISMNIRKAIRSLEAMEVKTIDTILVNNRYCFNMAGTGFDAEVAFEFENKRFRGLANYIVSTLMVFKRYRSIKVSLEIEGFAMDEEVFLLSIANSRQFGNNAYVAPLANLTDGLFDICIVKIFPLWYTPALVFRLFSKSLHKSKYYKSFKAKNACIYGNKTMRWHIDGEPLTISGPVNLSIMPKSLKVLAVSDHRA